MKIKELIKKYVNEKGKGHERRVGRYWASDLYAILSRRMEPNTFLTETKKDITACGHILRGEEKENTLKRIFDFTETKYSYQKKKIIKIGNIELVVVADFLFDDMLLELKSPKIMPNGIKKWHIPQLEAEYRAFKIPVYIGYIYEWPNLICYKYKLNDKLWELIKKELKEFDERLRKLNEQTSKGTNK